MSELELRRFIIVGSGSSASTPKMGCALNNDLTCAACNDAATVGPTSKNHRLNPSAVLQFNAPTSPEPLDDAVVDAEASAEDPMKFDVNVLIDCGKTFRESVFKVLIPHNVRSVDAVLLTHFHADATLGLDDLREFTSATHAIQILSDQNTVTAMRVVFPYLFPKEPEPTTEVKGSAPHLQVRWVATTTWKTFLNDSSLSTIHFSKPRMPSSTVRFVSLVLCTAVTASATHSSFHSRHQSSLRGFLCTCPMSVVWTMPSKNPFDKE